MTNDKIAQDTYRKLAYFYEHKLAVHFKDFNNVFYNGTIEDLDEAKKVLVLNEKVRGMMPFLLEHINPESIFLFKEVGK